MVVRIAGIVTVLAVVILVVITRSEPDPVQAQLAAPVPPRSSPALPQPMFSPAYVESLREASNLEDAQVAVLEQRLGSNPHDQQTRLKLMAFHQRADRASHLEDRSKRLQHALWLIENHPESEILRSPVSRFSPAELRPAEYQRAVALWDAATTGHKSEADVQWNAASFFEGLDGGLHMQYLEATAAADANHPHALRPLAHLYALAILEGGPLASRAPAGLEASKNVWVLGNAAYMLQSQYNRSVQMGATKPRAAELAERYFLRAKAIDPNLDWKAILPQLDLEAIARARQTEEQSRQDWEARAGEALEKLRRLPVEDFPELPAAVAGVLRSRGCRVPQPWLEGGPRNVIRGEFFVKGEAGWAVLCSVNNSTALLAFRNDSDTTPATVNTSEDRRHLQGVDRDKIGYSRQIVATGRYNVMGYYRRHGGSGPPLIDRHGIEDVFLEKASTIWYFHRGKWMTMPGAD